MAEATRMKNLETALAGLPPYKRRGVDRTARLPDGRLPGSNRRPMAMLRAGSAPTQKAAPNNWDGCRPLQAREAILFFRPSERRARRHSTLLAWLPVRTSKQHPVYR